jgi:fructose-bisphosphate aldolase class II
MGLVNLQSVLLPAHDQRYAVGSFNIINSDFADAIISAGVRKNSPLILSVAEVHLRYVKLEAMARYVTELAERTDIPIVLHLDHGETLQVIQRATACGFTSVMIDASARSFSENIDMTGKVVELCHPAGISVEAELGAVGDSESGEADPTLFTDPALVQEFVSSTGIDALAVAIGNVHGRYKGEPQIDFNLLECLRHQAAVPLVLHGGSGISVADFKRAVSLGISKINVFTSMAQKAIHTTKTHLLQLGNSYHDYPELLNDVSRSIGLVVEEHMEVFGSSGMAVTSKEQNT